MRVVLIGAMAVSLTASGLGCRRSDAGTASAAAAPAPAPAPETAPVPDAAFLRAAVARAQLRFHERQGAHRARGDFYEIEARGDGAVSVGVLSSAGERQGTLSVRTLAIQRRGWARRGVDRLAAADAALSIHRGPVEERWENSAGHTRQSWAFAKAPPGEGPLEVQVSLTGLPLAGATAQALHFAREGQPGFRYGDVAWVDGAGVRTPLPLRFAGETASIQVPPELLARSRYPAVLDPTVGPERHMDQPLVGHAWQSQRNAAIAGNANNYLVVWDDARHIFSGDIYGEMFSRFGRPSVISTNIPIAVGLGTAENPAVANNGTRFLVVWTEEDRTNNRDIRGVFVEAGSGVGAPFSITSDPSEQGLAAVAADPVSRRFLVAYWDLREGVGRVYASLVDGDVPQKLGSDLRLSGTVGTAGNPSVAHDGTNFVVAWEDTRNGPTQIYANRVNTVPAALDGTGVRLDATAFNQSGVTVSGGGGQSMAVWEESRDGGPTDLFGRLLRSGVPQLPAPFPVRAFSGTQQTPALAFDGTRYWLAYNYASTGVSEIHAARFRTDGGVEGAERTVPTDGGLFSRPAIAGFNNDMGLVFDDTPGFTDELGDVNYTRGFDSVGNISFNSFPDDVSVISMGANAQLVPEAASDGTQYLVVWSDERNPASELDVYGMRLDLQGVPKDPMARLIGGGPRDQLYPHVAYGGGTFLVTWSDEERQQYRYDLVGTRVDPSGAVLDSPKRWLFDAGANTVLDESISYGAGAFLIALEAGNRDLRAVQVAPSGAVLSPPTGLLRFPDGGSDPSLTFDGTNHVLAFLRGSIFTSSRVYAARIRTDGGVIDPDGIEVSQGAGNRFEPGVLFDGQRHLVFWSEIRPTGDMDVLGAYLSSAGVPTAQLPLVTTPNAQAGVSGTFDGEKALLVWNEMDLDAGQVRLQAGWIADGGQAVSAFAQVSSEVRLLFFQKPSAPAGSGTGQALVPYFRGYVAPGYNAERVLARVVDSRGALGTGCTGNLQCRSGFCSDGVCCDAACGASNPDDCQACSAGGACTMAPGTQQCRASQGVCDPAEACDGVNGACPADVRAGPSTVCNAALGPCDLPETCDGVSAACPADRIAPATYECRPAQGGCDVAETCDGVQLSCPSDQIAGAGIVCRPAAGTCDVEEICSGASRLCPDEVVLADGTACENNGICQAGTCSTARTSYYGWHCQGCAGGGAGAAPWAALALAWAALRRRRWPRSPRAPSSPGGLRRRWAVVAAAGLALGAPGQAAEEISRLLFVGIVPKAGVTQEQADTAGSFIQSELTSFGAYRVTGSAEIAAVLGVERQKMLLGCTEQGPTCLAELAGGLDADRVLAGDLGILGSELLLNLTLVDARTSRPIHRTVVRAAVTGSIDQILDGVKPALFELIVKDAARRGPEVKLDRGFGGLVASLRGEADVGDVAGRAFTPAISMELSAKRLGGALTVLVQPLIGVRAEGRFYPMDIGALRPYVGLGATSFVPAVGGRVVAGAALRLGQLHLHADAAYEYFFNPAPGYYPSAVLVATGAGWQF